MMIPTFEAGCLIHDTMPDVPDPDACRWCGIDLDSPSAAGAEDGICGPCIEEVPF